MLIRVSSYGSRWVVKSPRVINQIWQINPGSASRTEIGWANLDRYVLNSCLGGTNSRLYSVPNSDLNSPQSARTDLEHS